jgi:hypothetical protein
MEEEAEIASKMLRMSKAVGVVDIQAKLLIEGNRIVAEPFAMLFTVSLKSLFPDSWELGVITTIYKIGHALNYSNYRGVTISSTLAMLYSPVLNLRLTE